MRKPTFCICENKDADQLCGYREADQRLCSHYTDSTNHLFFNIRNFKPLAILCSCTAWFVSDQVGNQNVSFLATLGSPSGKELFSQFIRIKRPYDLYPTFYIITGIYRGIHYFLIFALNIDCRYSLEPPHRGGFNVYPQPIF